MEINTRDVVNTNLTDDKSKTSFSLDSLPGFVMPLFTVIITVMACGTVVIMNPKVKVKTS